MNITRSLDRAWKKRNNQRKKKYDSTAEGNHKLIRFSKELEETK